VILEGVESPKAALVVLLHGARRRALFGRKNAKRQLRRAEMNAWIRRCAVMLIGPTSMRARWPVAAGAVKSLHTLRPVIVVIAGAREKGLKCAAAIWTK